MAEPKNKPVVNLASAAEGAEVKVTDDGTLPEGSAYDTQEA